MRVLNTKVFDDAVEGTSSVYISPVFNARLGAADTFWIVVVATQVTGTLPTLTVQVETGANDLDFVNLSGTAEINAQSLTAGARNLVGSAQITNTFGFTRLRIQLAGTTPAARLEVWVTARDPKTA